MSLSDRDASAVLLSVTSAVGIFTALLPELSEVRKSVGDPDMVNDVRMGEGAAAALVVGIGLTASTITDSSAPAYASIVCALGLVFLFESVLHSTPKERKATA